MTTFLFCAARRPCCPAASQPVGTFAWPLPSGSRGAMFKQKPARPIEVCIQSPARTHPRPELRPSARPRSLNSPRRLRTELGLWTRERRVVPRMEREFTQLSARGAPRRGIEVMGSQAGQASLSLLRAGTRREVRRMHNWLCEEGYPGGCQAGPQCWPCSRGQNVVDMGTYMGTYMGTCGQNVVSPVRCTSIKHHHRHTMGTQRLSRDAALPKGR